MNAAGRWARGGLLIFGKIELVSTACGFRTQTITSSHHRAAAPGAARNKEDDIRKSALGPFIVSISLFSLRSSRQPPDGVVKNLQADPFLEHGVQFVTWTKVKYLAVT